MTEPPARYEYWRVFPWDSDASSGEPFSARFVPPAGVQTGGRFDLNGIPSVQYLAETPVHAVCEILRHFRGRTLSEDHLMRRDRNSADAVHPLALARAYLPADAASGIADLCEPETLAVLGLRADEIASGNRVRTQAISRLVHQRGHTGLRWWSALKGDWHSTVVYLDRVPIETIGYGEPEALSVRHEHVLEAAREVGLAVPPG